MVRIEAETRRVVLGTRADLARRTLIAGEANWLIDPPSNRCGASPKSATSTAPRRAK